MKKHEPSSFEVSKTSGSMLPLILETGIFIFLIVGGAWLINEAIPYGRWTYIERKEWRFITVGIAFFLGVALFLADVILSRFFFKNRASLASRLSSVAFDLADMLW